VPIKRPPGARELAEADLEEEAGARVCVNKKNKSSKLAEGEKRAGKREKQEAGSSSLAVVWAVRAASGFLKQREPSDRQDRCAREGGGSGLSPSSRA
jgi:hypothetical protein